MLLSTSRFRRSKRRLATLALAGLLVAGGAALGAEDQQSVGSEKRLIADAARCFADNQKMAMSLVSYVPSDNGPPTDAQRKQIEAVDKLAKAVFRAEAALPALNAAVAAAGTGLPADPVLQAALERVAKLKSESEATTAKESGAVPPQRHGVEAASDRAGLADIFIEPECRAINAAAAMTVGDVVKNVVLDGSAQISKMSDADLHKGISSILERHDQDEAAFADGARGAAKFWYGQLLNALSPDEIAMLQRYRAASQVERVALVDAYRKAVKDATAGLLLDYVRGSAMTSP